MNKKTSQSLENWEKKNLCFQNKSKVTLILFFQIFNKRFYKLI